jgi:hypothetical protein
MKSGPFRITGPYVAKNLALYLVHAKAPAPGAESLTLQEGHASSQVMVHETGNVGELAIENLHETLDLFIQAGELVRGGRQDRTFGADFIVTARSGRVPIPTFCVERGRWGRRRTEAANHFSTSDHLVST